MELQGTLNFTSLVSHCCSNISNKSVINALTSDVQLINAYFDFVQFADVDFRGIGDNTDVYLDVEIVCVPESVYPDIDTSDYI